MRLRTSAVALSLSTLATGVALAVAPMAAACPPGFYPTDTSGVCSDNPPANRPAHVQPKDLPAPIQGALTPGRNDMINTWTEQDDDHDGVLNGVDHHPEDPHRS